MNIDTRKKHQILASLRRLEDGIINIVVRKQNNRSLKKHKMSKSDDITPEYKKEIKAYWKRYTRRVNADWHKFYSSRTGVYDVRYIPDDMYHTNIDRHFNNKRFCKGINDKNYSSLLFPDVAQPPTVARKINGFYYDSDYNLIKKDDFIGRCMTHARLIIKPAIGYGKSQGIVFWERSQGANPLLELLSKGEMNLIVQDR